MYNDVVHVTVSDVCCIHHLFITCDALVALSYM